LRGRIGKPDLRLRVGKLHIVPIHWEGRNEVVSAVVGGRSYELNMVSGKQKNETLSIVLLASKIYITNELGREIMTALRTGESGAAMHELLLSLMHAGNIMPSGSRWTWPAACSGRLEPGFKPPAEKNLPTRGFRFCT